MRFKIVDDYGKWMGRGVGSLRQLSIPYKTSVLLDSTRNYEINIFHLINKDPLHGIEKVGIRVYK
jgi:gliding motility-associated lipoprotein GldH